MANVKFSQFNSVASLSATGQIVGFDGANNIRLTKAALEGSLNLGNLAGAVDAATQVINVLAVGNGGTGLSSYTQGDILYGDSAGGLSKLAAGAAGEVLTTNGAGADPSWGSPTFSGILAEANGGTGQTAPYLNTQISYRSKYRAYWFNNVSWAYSNIPRGTEYAMVTNVASAPSTTHPTSSGITSSFVSTVPSGTTTFFTNNATRYVLAAGTYDIRVSGYFFDQTADLDTVFAIYTQPASGFGTTKYLMVDQKANESSGDRLFQGSLSLTFTVDQWVWLTIRFDNGSTDPFPQSASNRFGLEIEFIRLF